MPKPHKTQAKGRNRDNATTTPHVVTRYHVNIRTSMSGVYTKRVDIVPTLSNFSAALVDAAQYESYKITKVLWQLHSLTPVNIWNGSRVVGPL